MENAIVKKETAPLIPGIGIAGMVMCPFGFQRSPCLKNGCELWVELTQGETKIARCALSWIPILATETTGVINKLVVPSTTHKIQDQPQNKD